jgi:hypothetical protein
MTPFDKAVEVVVLGREHEMDLPAIERVEIIIIIIIVCIYKALFPIYYAQKRGSETGDYNR